MKKEINVDGIRALQFDLYGWQVDSQSNVWVPEVFFEKDDFIYEIKKSATISNTTFDQILLTFKFKK